MRIAFADGMDGAAFLPPYLQLCSWLLFLLVRKVTLDNAPSIRPTHFVSNELLGQLGILYFAQYYMYVCM